MKLEDQVSSLGPSKRLEELGVQQGSSLFAWSYWMDHAAAEGVSDCHEKHWQVTTQDGGNMGERYDAFTVAELGEILRGRGMGTTAFSQMTGKWWVAGGEWLVGKQAYAHTVDDVKEADARAKMLIHLIENKLVTP